MNKIVKLYRAVKFAIGTIYYSIRIINGMRKSPLTFFPFSKGWGAFFLKCYKINMTVEGVENVDPNQRYIIMPNHESLLDIPLIFDAFPNKMVFMYKKELEKIPIFGDALIASPLLPVVRENPRAAFESLDRDLERLKECGSSLNIFPEGTRFNKPDIVGPFKRGAIMIAKRAALPILPVAVIGPKDLLPAGDLLTRSGNIKIVFGKPIEIEALSDKQNEMRIVEEIRQWIISKIKENEDLNK